MKKKTFFVLLIVAVFLCVCLVGCDNDTANPGNDNNQTDIGSNDNQDNQTDKEDKNISSLANKDKFTYYLDKSIGSIESPRYDYDFVISLEVDFTKLSNYKEILAQLGLSENYETPEEKIEAGYYTKLNEYYTDLIKGYFPNGKNFVEKELVEDPTAELVILNREQYTKFWYDTFDEANKEYDSLLSLAKREEVTAININGYIPIIDL